MGQSVAVLPFLFEWKMTSFVRWQNLFFMENRWRHTIELIEKKSMAVLFYETFFGDMCKPDICNSVTLCKCHGGGVCSCNGKKISGTDVLAGYGGSICGFPL